MTDVLIRRGDRDKDADMHRGKTTERHGEKNAICKPRREALQETRPASTLISDF